MLKHNLKEVGTREIDGETNVIFCRLGTWEWNKSIQDYEVFPWKPGKEDRIIEETIKATKEGLTELSSERRSFDDEDWYEVFETIYLDNVVWVKGFVFVREGEEES